jgi:hypothetical protein
LIELINYEMQGESTQTKKKSSKPSSKVISKPNKRMASMVSRQGSKRVKLPDLKEETKKQSTVSKIKSNAYSNDSFGGSKASKKFRNKELDEIMKYSESDNDSDKDSIDMNLGKKIKMTLKNENNAANRTTNDNVFLAGRYAQKEMREQSSMSFLQLQRNISKTSSAYQKIPSFNKLTSTNFYQNDILKNNLQINKSKPDFLQLRTNSEIFKFSPSPGKKEAHFYMDEILYPEEKVQMKPENLHQMRYPRRLETKVYNFNHVDEVHREESNPIFNGGIFHDFNGSEHFNQREISVVKNICDFDNPSNYFMTERLKSISKPKHIRINSNAKQLSNPTFSESFSFGKKPQTNGRAVSHPMKTRNRSTVNGIKQKTKSVPFSLSNGAFSKFKK